LPKERASMMTIIQPPEQVDVSTTTITTALDSSIVNGEVILQCLMRRIARTVCLDKKLAVMVTSSQTSTVYSIVVQENKGAAGLKVVLILT
jgi:hypothetical protein